MNTRDQRGKPRLSSALACLAAAVGLVFCSSCSTPPEPDDGLLGIIYNTSKQHDAGYSTDRMVRVTPASSPAAAPAATATPAGSIPLAAGPEPVPQVSRGTNVLSEESTSYRISPGDVLAVSYFARPSGEMMEYLIDNQDVLTISVAGQQTHTADVVVRPDGNISFFLIGELRARGLTVAQVRSEVTLRMAKFMPAAEVTVILKVGNALTSEFLNTLRSNTDLGSTRIMQVRSDGTVTFPLVGEVHAMGKTLSGLSHEIEKQYDRLFKGGLSLALNLNSSSDGNIAVLGEVRNPGRYTIGNPVSPFFALAMAGGALDSAKKSQVVVVNRKPDGRVGWHVVNLDINSGKPLGPEIPLAPQDMLLVPRTSVANLNQFVDQYIRRMMPVPTSLGFGYNLN